MRAPVSSRNDERSRLLLLPLVRHDAAAVAPVRHDVVLYAKRSEPHELLGLSLVAASAVCFSVVTTLVKFETLRGFSAMETIFWRSSVAFTLNRIAMLYNGIPTSVAREHRSAMLMQCVFGFSCIAFGFYAISRMVLADASALIFTSPLLTFFLGACLLQERIDGLSLTFAILSSLGLVCVVRPALIFGHPELSRGPPLAIAAALLAAVTQSLLYICVRKLQTLNSLVIAHYYAAFSSISALTFILLFQNVFRLPSNTAEWAGMLGIGVCAFIGQITLTKGFQLEHAGMAAVMRYLDVVCVFVWDSIFLQEPISGWSVLGAATICACAVVIALRKAQLV
ncbi:hypothetical protein PINS_up010815 [Pythium insidiosum]|nr:hypothetical protein PINS_up010815 [Pythium insidiosum]